VASLPQASPTDVAVLLRRLRSGDRTSLDDLFAILYPELRKLAGGCFRQEGSGHVLQPTALVNEAYVRLIGQRQLEWQNRAHFLGAVAQVMRRILVDHARANQAGKRGGGRVAVALHEADVIAEPPRVELLALDEALRELEGVSSRQARIVELRYFGGLSVPETAEALGMNPRTVDRDWAAARVWLRRKLQL
jgi:RNA polymerase sigma factor (TIGR02999 family)